MSAFESVQDEFSVVGGEPLIIQDGLRWPSPGWSSIERLDMLDSSTDSHPHVPSFSSLSIPEWPSSPNSWVASNSALTGSSSMSSRKRGVSGMAKRKSSAITPGTTPMPMIHRHMLSTDCSMSVLLELRDILTTTRETRLLNIWPSGCMKKTVAIIRARCFVGANLSEGPLSERGCPFRPRQKTTTTTTYSAVMTADSG